MCKTLLALMLLAVTARATDLQYSATVNNTPTDWIAPLPIQQFNPAYGKLTNVIVSAQWSNHRKATLANLNSTNSYPYKIAYTNTVRVRFPGGVVVGEETYAEVAAGTLEPFGSFSGDLTNTGNITKKTCVDFAPVSAAWVGTGTLTFQGEMDATVDTSTMDWTTGFIYPTILTEGWMILRVTYQYTTGTGTAWPCH